MKPSSSKETPAANEASPSKTARPRRIVLNASSVDNTTLVDLLTRGDVRTVIVERGDGSLHAILPTEPSAVARANSPKSMPPLVCEYENNGWSCRLRKGQWHCCRRIGGMVISTIVEI